MKKDRLREVTFELALQIVMEMCDIQNGKVLIDVNTTAAEKVKIVRSYQQRFIDAFNNIQKKEYTIDDFL